MEAPHGISPDEFQARLDKWLAEHCKKVDDHWVCKETGEEIQQTNYYVSLHDSRFSGCSGSGECNNVPLPYCKTHDPKPSVVYGCVHV